MFHLNEHTGQLVIAAPLDREQHAEITLYVSASYRSTTTTSDASPRTDHTIVRVRLLDCNDNAPRFTRSIYTATLHVNTAASGTAILRAHAADNDAAVDSNARVVYSIDPSEHSHWFSVDPRTGVVSLRAHIHFDDPRTPDTVEVTIRARDSPTAVATSLTSTALVRVSLDPTPKYAPQCLDHGGHFQPLAGRAPILGLIRARDPDLGARADVSFKLLTQFDVFELKPSGLFNTVLLASRPGVFLKNSKVCLSFLFSFLLGSC